MKTLSPLILKNKYFEPIEERINDILWEVIYAEIAKVLKGTAVTVKNDNDPLTQAIVAGKIYYKNGTFFGQFSSQTSKELKSLGAEWKKGGWKLPRSKFNPSLNMALSGAESTFKKKNEAIIKALDDAEYKSEQYELELGGAYKKTTKLMDEEFAKTVKSISIAPKLTTEITDRIAEEWGENLDLYIKDWTKENILKLRDEVSRNTYDGQRAENLVKLIQKNFKTSKNKAKFLARQETSLLMSKYQEQRYRSLGLEKYVWSTAGDERVRDEHKELNGKVIEWANPPITDDKGNRNHAGEDYGCRCIAVPIVE